MISDHYDNDKLQTNKPNGSYTYPKHLDLQLTLLSVIYLSIH